MGALAGHEGRQMTGEEVLMRAILSNKHPKALAAETRHSNPSTLAYVLDHPFPVKRVALYDNTAVVMTEVVIRKHLLMCFVTRLQRRIVRDVINQRRQKTGRRGRRFPGVGKQAAQVFYLLCNDHSETDISKILHVSRERVRQVKEKLKTLPTIQKFHEELKGVQSGKW